MRSASSQRWRRRHKFTARRRERSRECSRVHQYNSFCAPWFTSGVWMWRRSKSFNEFRVFCFFSSKRHGEGQPRFFPFLHFLDASFRRGGWKDTNARINAEIKKEIISFFSCRLSLHLFTFWLHDLYTRMLSQFHFSLDAHKTPKGKIYNEQLFQNYWRDYYVPFLRS